jgi:hypothetical protein
MGTKAVTVSTLIPAPRTHKFILCTETWKDENDSPAQKNSTASRFKSGLGGAVLGNEDPSGGEAQNGAGQAGDEDVQGVGVRLGCHSRSSDLSAQADLEHS